MTDRQQFLTAAVDRHREAILAAERHVWRHPELGFQEWKTTEYYKERFASLGYEIQGPADIPGFYVDIDTGRPGPRVLFCGELDALPSDAHPEAVDGKVHSCGHHVQCAAVYGLAAALKEPGVLDGLCGSVRIALVPAEEGDTTGFRAELRRKGVIEFYTGKLEFMRRGYFDGCDIGFMFHALSRDPADFSCDCRGSNGARSKHVKILGKTAHGSRPDLGVNAMNAATLIMNAVNAMKDTFPPEAGMGLTVTLTNPGVGPIAAETELVIGFRGASYTAMLDAERRLARTVYAAAAAIGATVEMTDDPGYAPMRGDAVLTALTKEALTELVGADKVDFRDVRNPGGTDMGDVSNVIPCVHPYVCGSAGTTHSAAFMVTDPVRACVNAAKGELFVLDKLLSNGAERAHEVISSFVPLYPSMAAYVESSRTLFAHRVSVLGENSVELQNVEE